MGGGIQPVNAATLKRMKARRRGTVRGSRAQGGFKPCGRTRLDAT